MLSFEFWFLFIIWMGLAYSIMRVCSILAEVIKDWWEERLWIKK